MGPFGVPWAFSATGSSWAGRASRVDARAPPSDSRRTVQSTGRWKRAGAAVGLSQQQTGGGVCGRGLRGSLLGCAPAGRQSRQASRAAQRGRPGQRPRCSASRAMRTARRCARRVRPMSAQGRRRYRATADALLVLRSRGHRADNPAVSPHLPGRSPPDFVPATCPIGGHGHGSGQTVPEAIMALTCGNGLSRTAPDPRRRTSKQRSPSSPSAESPCGAERVGSDQSTAAMCGDGRRARSYPPRMAYKPSPQAPPRASRSSRPAAWWKQAAVPSPTPTSSGN